MKISLGKISLKGGWFQTIQNELEANAILWLPINMGHYIEVFDLPFHHLDLFDRMLIAQAVAEGMHMLSRDIRLSAYPIKRIW